MFSKMGNIVSGESDKYDRDSLKQAKKDIKKELEILKKTGEEGSIKWYELQSERERLNKL